MFTEVHHNPELVGEVPMRKLLVPNYFVDLFARRDSLPRPSWFRPGPPAPEPEIDNPFEENLKLRLEAGRRATKKHARIIARVSAPQPPPTPDTRFPHSAATPVRSTILFVAAIGLTLLANFWFTREVVSRTLDVSPLVWGKHQNWACFALLGALVAAFFAFSRQDDFPRAPARVRLPEDAGWWTSPWLYTAAGLACYIISLALYWQQGETPAVRMWWGASLLGLLAALVRPHAQVRGASFPFWEFILLSAITLVGFGVRFSELTAVPFNIDVDLGIMGFLSRLLVDNHDWRLVGMAPTMHQYSEHQILATSLRIFGADHRGLVMVGVLAGTATVPVLYFIGRLLANRWVGFLAAAFLATDYVHLHFSRLMFGPVATLFVTAGSLAVLHGIKRERLGGFVLGGILFGLGLMDYYSGRVGPVVLLAMFVLWWPRRHTTRISMGHWAIAAAGVVFVFGPNLICGWHGSASLQGRGNEVLIWTDRTWNHLADKYHSTAASVIWTEQLKRTFLAPFYFPDESTLSYLRKPMLGVVAEVAFVLGLGFSLRCWRRWESFYPLAVIAVTFSCGGFLTYDPPYWPHLNMAVPAMCLVAALGLERMLRPRATTSPRALWRWAAPLLAVGAMVFSALQNWEVYYRFARNHIDGRALVIRQVQTLAPECEVLLSSQTLRWNEETFRFFVPQATGRSLSEAEVEALPAKVDRPTALFIVYDGRESQLAAVAEKYPTAQHRVFRNGWAIKSFSMFMIYPDGYVQGPPAAKDREPTLWNLPGSWVFATVLGAVTLVGCWTWLRERREDERFWDATLRNEPAPIVMLPNLERPSELEPEARSRVLAGDFRSG